MTNDEIHAALFGQRWQQCTLRLSNGDVITVPHPDYLFMPPAQNWVLWVKPGGRGFQFIPCAHIAVIDLQPRSVTDQPSAGLTKPEI
jgi:hypothetical protein